MTVLPLTADKYPVEKLPPGWATADVKIRHANGTETHRYEVLDLRFDSTIDHATRYLHEPMSMIAFKCFALFLVGLPIYFLVYAAYQFIRTPIVTLVNLSPIAFLKQIWNIGRIPIYFVGLEYAAFYGIFNPLEGRALFGRIEGAFHEKGLHESLQHRKDDPTLKELCIDSMITLEYPYATFAGVCMQPIGKTDDPHVVSVTLAALDQVPQVV
jgi:hypothetical protein